MFWESNANLADQRHNAVLDLAKDANRRAKESETKNHAVDKKTAASELN